MRLTLNSTEPPWYVTRMPGGVGGRASRDALLSRSTLGSATLEAALGVLAQPAVRFCALRGHAIPTPTPCFPMQLLSGSPYHTLSSKGDGSHDSRDPCAEREYELPRNREEWPSALPQHPWKIEHERVMHQCDSVGVVQQRAAQTYGPALAG